MSNDDYQTQVRRMEEQLKKVGEEKDFLAVQNQKLIKSNNH